MYCRILKKVIKETKKQFYDRLTAQSDKKTKTTWNIINNETARMHPIEQVPSSLVNMGTLKDKKQWQIPSVNFFNNFREIKQIQVWKMDAISFLMDSFPGNLLTINIITITEAEINILYLLDRASLW